MNYKISKELRDDIIKAFYELNAPVKIFENVQKALNGLEEIKDEPVNV